MFIVQVLSQLKRLPHLLDYQHCTFSIVKDFLTTLLFFHVSLALALCPLFALYPAAVEVRGTHDHTSSLFSVLEMCLPYSGQM